MQNLPEATIEFGAPAKRASLMWPKNIACFKSAPPLFELNFQRKSGTLNEMVDQSGASFVDRGSITMQYVAARSVHWAKIL